jgi:hypothetical protein
MQYLSTEKKTVYPHIHTAVGNVYYILLSLKIKLRASGVTQVTSKHETPSSKPSASKKKKNQVKRLFLCNTAYRYVKCLSRLHYIHMYTHILIYVICNLTLPVLLRIQTPMTQSLMPLINLNKGIL